MRPRRAQRLGNTVARAATCAGLWLLAVRDPLAAETWLAGVAADRLESTLEAATGGEVRLEGVALAPLDGSLVIEHLALQGGTGVVQSLEADGLTVTASTWQLLGGTLRLEEIAADRLRLELGPARDTKRSGPPPDVRLLSELKRLRIADGAVSYRDGTAGFVLAASSLQVDGAAQGAALGGELSFGPLRLQGADQRQLSVESVRGRWHWHAPRLALDELTLDGKEAALRGDALVTFTGEGISTRGTLHGEVELGPLARWLVAGAVSEITGRAAVDARFRAAVPGTWQLEGEARSAGPIAAGGESWSQVALPFRLSPGALDCGPGRASSGSGLLVDQVTFGLVDGAWRAAAMFDGALDPWLARFGLMVPELRGSRLRAQLELTPHGAGLFDGALRGRVDRSRSEAVEGELSVLLRGDTGSLDLRGRWGTAPLQLQLGLELAARLRVTGWQLQGELQRADRDGAATILAALRRLAEQRGVETLAPLHPEVQGSLSASFTARGDERALRAFDTRFVASSPRFGETRFDRLEGRLVQQGRAWQLELRLADPIGQGLELQSEIAAGRAPTIKARADGVPIGLLLFALERLGGQPMPALEGTFSATVDGRFGRGEQLALVAEGALHQARFGSFDVELRGALDPDGLQADDARLIAKGFSCEARGRLAWRAGPLFSGQLGARADLTQLPIDWPLHVASGVVSASAVGTLETFDQPVRLDGELVWSGVDAAGRRLPDGSALLTPRPDGVMLAIAGEPLAVQLVLSGGLRDPHLEAQLSWRDLDLAALIEQQRGVALPVALSAYADGSFAWAGPLLDPARWAGQGELRRLEIQGPTLGGTMDGIARVRLDPGGVVVIPAEAPLQFVGDRGSRLLLLGSATVLGADAGAIDLTLGGAIDLGSIEVLHPDLLASGRIGCELRIRGPFARPAFDGTLRVTRGRLRLLPYPESVDGLLLTLRFSGSEATVEQGRFRLGGGEVAVTGRTALEGWTPSTLRVGFELRSVGLSLPRGVWGRYSGALELAGSWSEPELRGRLELLAGRYTREFGIGTFERVRIVEPSSGGTSLWNRIGLKLSLVAPEAVSIRNQMAHMQASAQLEISGTARRPLLAGTIVLLEGGRLTFRDVEYEVQSGLVTLDDAGGQPVELRLRATTSVRGYNVTLELDATTERLDYRLSTTPALPEADVLSLLITGQTQGEFGGDSGVLSTEAATAYFGSELGELLLGNTARRVFKVDQFSIAPSQVGPETSPTARITVGRRVGERTRVIYSRDISVEGRDLYRLERDVSRDWRMTLGKEPLGGTAIDARWLHRFGVGKEALEQVAQVRDLKLQGLPDDVRPSAADLGLRRGTPATRGAIADARDALRVALVRAGYLEAQVLASSTDVRGPFRDPLRVLDVTLLVTPGRHWDLRFVGPKALVTRCAEVLADLWAQTGVATGGFREEQSVLKEVIADEGYAAGTVDITAPAGQLQITITIDPGPKVVVARVELAGNHAIGSDQLEQQILSRPGSLLEGRERAVYRPRQVREDADAIRTLYEQRGYLEAQVGLDERLRSDGAAVELRFVVTEGSRWRLGAIRVEGDWPEALGGATGRLKLESGDWYDPQRIAEAELALREALDAAGYYEAAVQSRLEIGVNQRLDATFRVLPGRAATLRSVRFEGLLETRRKLVERTLALTPGAPLTRRGLRDTERALFRLGLFRRVELQIRPLEARPGLADVVIVCEEVPPVSVLASIGYDTEESLRASGSITNENLAGLGRTGSLQALLSARRRNLRATLEDRHLRRGRWQGLGTVLWQQEERDGFTIDSAGLTLQVGLPDRALDRWQVRYELQDNHFSDVLITGDALRELLLAEGRRGLEDVRLGGLIGSFTIDRRDDPFRPARGWMIRSEAGIWGTALGSEVNFLRLTTGATRLWPLPGRVTVVGGFRLGWTKTYGRAPAVPLSQRFFAGGSNSLRGFELDTVGPRDATSGAALGGQVLALANAEARIRLFSSVELTLFADAGNVWLDTSIDDEQAAALAQQVITDPFGTLRTDAGIGLRYVTPVGALRVEYGFNLNARSGESPGQFFFSIGEAF